MILQRFQRILDNEGELLKRLLQYFAACYFLFLVHSSFHQLRLLVFHCYFPSGSGFDYDSGSGFDCDSSSGFDSGSGFGYDSGFDPDSDFGSVLRCYCGYSSCSCSAN